MMKLSTKVSLAAVLAAASFQVSADAVQGQKVYQQACFACHASGAAGSPKLGDKDAWAPRIATGMDAMVASAVNGKGAMPPKGGFAHLTDEQIRNAVEYMVSQSK